MINNKYLSSFYNKYKLNLARALPTQTLYKSVVRNLKDIALQSPKRRFRVHGLQTNLSKLYKRLNKIK